MERQEFLKTLGISFAAVCVGTCFSYCSKKDDATPANNTPPPPSGTFVSADLSEFLGVGFKKEVSVAGVSIAIFRIADGDSASSFIATQPLCTHQEGLLDWKSGSNSIQCRRHFAEFDKNGINTKNPNVPGNAPNLKTYPLTVADGKVNVKVA